MSEASSLCWLTNIQTTSLQMVNHFKYIAEIHADSKQDVNQPFTRDYILYDMKCAVNKMIEHLL